MSNKSVSSKEASDKLVKNIRRKTARKYSAEEKIRIVLAGLRGEESIAALCRRESIRKLRIIVFDRIWLFSRTTCHIFAYRFRYSSR